MMFAMIYVAMFSASCLAMSMWLCPIALKADSPAVATLIVMLVIIAALFVPR